eukprot:CAMPEP_0172163110 /NCGR_PEP_ID=MMETSP1050-20130122/7086_1 /TAXON_ID=233186 /ORGANISM="Cryptomonas curvata, Strain CCAP979/52" /LENGTH=293 /DNA_ID=CAMNT_0012833257 /DNA_START=99 /DNA_END=977 /DNA_ORIENTATION=-
MKMNFFEITFCMFVLLASANFCRISQSNGHGDSSSYANQNNRLSLSDSGIGSQNNDIGSCACKRGHTRKGARALLFQLRLSGGCADIDLVTHEYVAEHVAGKDVAIDADIESAMSDVSLLPDEAQRGRSRRRPAFDMNALNVADLCASSDSSPLPKRSPRLAEKNSARASCAGLSHASDISCSRSPSPNDAFDAPSLSSAQPASASPDRDERSQERFPRPTPFSTWANDAVRIRMVRGPGDLDDPARQFPPLFTHQVFGPREEIVGYDNPVLEIVYAANSLLPSFELRSRGRP